jgi:hypothetical protein
MAVQLLLFCILVLLININATITGTLTASIFNDTTCTGEVIAQMQYAEGTSCQLIPSSTNLYATIVYDDSTEKVTVTGFKTSTCSPGDETTDLSWPSTDKPITPEACMLNTENKNAPLGNSFMYSFASSSTGKLRPQERIINPMLKILYYNDENTCKNNPEIFTSTLMRTTYCLPDTELYFTNPNTGNSIDNTKLILRSSNILCNDNSNQATYNLYTDNTCSNNDNSDNIISPPVFSQPWIFDNQCHKNDKNIGYYKSTCTAPSLVFTGTWSLYQYSSSDCNGDVISTVELPIGTCYYDLDSNNNVDETKSPIYSRNEYNSIDKTFIKTNYYDSLCTSIKKINPLQYENKCINDYGTTTNSKSYQYIYIEDYKDKMSSSSPIGYPYTMQTWYKNHHDCTFNRLDKIIERTKLTLNCTENNLFSNQYQSITCASGKAYLDEYNNINTCENNGIKNNSTVLYDLFDDKCTEVGQGEQSRWYSGYCTGGGPTFPTGKTIGTFKEIYWPTNDCSGKPSSEIFNSVGTCYFDAAFIAQYTKRTYENGNVTVRAYKDPYCTEQTDVSNGSDDLKSFVTHNVNNEKCIVAPLGSVGQSMKYIYTPATKIGHMDNKFNIEGGYGSTKVYTDRLSCELSDSTGLLQYVGKTQSCTKLAGGTLDQSYGRVIYSSYMKTTGFYTYSDSTCSSNQKLPGAVYNVDAPGKCSPFHGYFSNTIGVGNAVRTAIGSRTIKIYNDNDINCSLKPSNESQIALGLCVPATIKKYNLYFYMLVQYDSTKKIFNAKGYTDNDCTSLNGVINRAFPLDVDATTCRNVPDAIYGTGNDGHRNEEISFQSAILGKFPIDFTSPSYVSKAYTSKEACEALDNTQVASAVSFIDSLCSLDKGNMCQCVKGIGANINSWVYNDCVPSVCAPSTAPTIAPGDGGGGANDESKSTGSDTSGSGGAVGGAIGGVFAAIFIGIYYWRKDKLIKKRATDAAAKAEYNTNNPMQRYSDNPNAYTDSSSL